MLKSVTKKLKPLIQAKLKEDYFTIANEANLYCLDYIERRFERSNIQSGLQFIRPKEISEVNSAVSAKIVEVGELLESAYPHLFHSASKQTRIKLRSEVIISDVFRTFGRELFRDSVTWARIVALFAFSGSLSVDCVVQGNPEFVKTVLNCTRLYVLDHLAVWIKNQGGWGILVENFKCIRTKQRFFSLLYAVPWIMNSLKEFLFARAITSAIILRNLMELLHGG